jgi:hypothetical protein
MLRYADATEYTWTRHCTASCIIIIIIKSNLGDIWGSHGEYEDDWLSSGMFRRAVW